MRFRINDIVRLFVFTVTCLALVVSSVGAKQKVSLVASLIGPIETAQGQGLEFFAKRVKELTGGEVEVKIYADGQLGGLVESLEQVQKGFIDLTTSVPGNMAEFVPEFQIYHFPFLFRDYSHWKAVITGQIGQKLSDIARQKAGMIIIGTFGGSVRNLVTRKRVTSIDDMKNLLIRLHPSEIQIKAWSAVGAIPTVVAYREIYSALQLKVIDALENEPEWVVRMKFYEQAQYIVLTAHEIVTRPVPFSERRFNSLSPEHQKAVLVAGREAGEYERELEHYLDQEYLKELGEKYGAQLIHIEQKAFREKTQAALEPVIKKFGVTELINQVGVVTPK